jgi:hypothetical protein
MPRAAPVVTGRDPQHMDRLGVAIKNNNFFLTTRSAEKATSGYRDRAFWQSAASRLGSDWEGVMRLRLSVAPLAACDVCGVAPCINPGFCAVCRDAYRKADEERRRNPVRQHPRPTPRVTVDAVLYSLAQRGLKALQEPATIERLSRCDKAALAQIDACVAKLKGRCQ